VSVPNISTIGVFDSGMGGLTVLKSLRQYMPDVNLIYLGDTARLPYGTKSPTTVINYALQAVEILLEYKIDIIVVACNTASSVAINCLEQRCKNVSIFGVILPGAIEVVCNRWFIKPIGVLATEATVRQGAYADAIHTMEPSAKVVSAPAQLLVALAEEGWHDGEIVEKILSKYIDSLIYQDIETLVLGCTHFPVFTKTIRQLYPSLNIVNSADTTASRIANTYRGIGSGKTTFLVTDSLERFKRVGAYFWHNSMNDIKLVDL